MFTRGRECELMIYIVCTDLERDLVNWRVMWMKGNIVIGCPGICLRKQNSGILASIKEGRPHINAGGTLKGVTVTHFSLSTRLIPVSTREADTRNAWLEITPDPTPKCPAVSTTVVVLPKNPRIPETRGGSGQDSAGCHLSIPDQAPSNGR